MMPSVSDVIAYENGEMGEDETIEFFQGMINSGAVWELQGSYGRMARDFIVSGQCLSASESEALLQADAALAEADMALAGPARGTA